MRRRRNKNESLALFYAGLYTAASEQPAWENREACVHLHRYGGEICCFLWLDVIPSIEDLCRCCASDTDNNRPLKLQNSEPYVNLPI